MIYLGSDHAGFALKEEVKAYCVAQGIAHEDYGTFSTDSVDFTDYALRVANTVAADRAQGGDALGVLCCGSGIGMDIAANKVKGARAALALNTYMGAQSREHDDANILVLAGRILEPKDAVAVLKAFLGATFDGQENHARRIKKIELYEDQHLKL